MNGDIRHALGVICFAAIGLLAGGALMLGNKPSDELFADPNAGYVIGQTVFWIAALVVLVGLAAIGLALVKNRQESDPPADR